MKKNLFEMGANFNDEWTSNNKEKQTTNENIELKEPSKHQLHFAKEKRRGKTVTLVGEFFLEKDDSSKLLKTLKKKLGCGGVFKDSFMEFQGDLKTKIRPFLVDENFRFKLKH